MPNISEPQSRFSGFQNANMTSATESQPNAWMLARSAVAHAPLLNSITQ